MKIKQRLQNIQKGYAEVFYYPKNDPDEMGLLDWGYVCIEKIPYKTNFENDEILYKKRWTIYIFCKTSFVLIGKKTGYDTRKKALKAFYDYVELIWASIEDIEVN